MRTILSTIHILLFCSSFTTTSAQQYYNVDLDVLGYSPKTKSVYVFESKVHNNSEQHIYAYNLKDKELKISLGEAKYLEINNAIGFNSTLSTLKKDLKKLEPIDINTLKIDVLTQNSSHNDNTPQFNTTYSTEFMVSSDQFKSKLQNLHHYTPEIKLKQAYLLPNHKGIIATFSSITYPFNTGFYREESILLLPKGTLKTEVTK